MDQDCNSSNERREYYTADQMKNEESEKSEKKGKKDKAIKEAENSKDVENAEDAGGDENKERGNWDNQFEFVLSCLGYAVGLGNVWRFPYLCYTNGGGAFFIPYIIMLVFVGIPIFFLELSLGQFTSKGPLTCWKFAPIFTGLGFGMVMVSGIVAIYYNMIIGWSLYYLFASFTTHLPWDGCYNEWNTENCYLKIPDVNCTEQDTVKNLTGTCYNTTSGNVFGLWNETIARKNGIIRRTASEEYYEFYVLGISKGIDNLGNVQWRMVLCLLLAWVIVVPCLFKGVKSSGKVVYFTALFPYAVLFILLIRGVTLEGHLDGVLFYITPDPSRLGDAKVWNDAAIQIFFSLSACWGGLITLSSYNRFNNNCLRDALIVSIGNCSTSVFAGFVIFAFLGHLAHELHTTVDKVVDSGAGLAFIVYPSAITRLPISPLWSFLFFFMIITLGLDSQFTLLETVITAFADRFSFLRRKKPWFIVILSVVLFLLGLPLTTQGGVYMLQLMDAYVAGWSILLIGFCETLALSWVYGWNRLIQDITLMVGGTPLLKGPLPWIWRISWSFLTPLLILVVLLFAWIDYSPATYGEYVFPVWSNVLGWLMSFSVVIAIPTYAVYALATAEGSFVQRLKTVTSPTVDWGPALIKHRQLVDYVPDFVVDPNDPDHHSLSGKARDVGESCYQNPAYEYTTYL